MTPTPEEKAWLKDYLYQIMEYRETYEEVYDHMVLAVAEAPEEKHFESVVAGVITRDFGGTNGLYDLEQKCKEAAEVNEYNQYLTNFKQWFQSPPKVGVTIIIFGSLFSAHHWVKLIGGWAIVLFATLIIAPGLIFFLCGLFLRIKYSKRSVKNEIFKTITFKPNRILWNIVVFSWIYNAFTRYVLGIEPSLNHPAKNLGPFIAYTLIGISSGIFMLLILHILSVFLLYLKEFKTNVTNQ